MFAREIERIIIVIIAGLAIYLGFRLFYIAKEKQGELQLQGKDRSIKLSDVAPGIYFALFGSFILVSAMFYQVESYTQKTHTEDAEGNVTTQTASRTIASVSEPDPDLAYLREFDAGKEEQYEVLIKIRNLSGKLADENEIPSKVIADDAFEKLKQEIEEIVTEEEYKNLLTETEDFFELNTFLHSYLPYFIASYSEEIG